MSQQYPPRRRPRRLMLLSAAAVAVAALAAWGVLRAALPGAAADYRDPVQLAQAIEAHEHGTAADCSKLPTGKYICAVARTGGAMGSYTVTVSPDGKSWTAG